MSVQTLETLQTAPGQTTVARRTSAQDAPPTPSEAASDGFNLSSWTLHHQPLVIFLLVLLALSGILAYGKLSQSEDPPFTFKVMVVRTLWPGATARQMQEQVTDRIARKLQESPEVDYLKSYSRPGESTLFFNIKDSVAPSKGSQTPGTRCERRCTTSATRFPQVALGRCDRVRQGPNRCISSAVPARTKGIDITTTMPVRSPRLSRLITSTMPIASATASTKSLTECRTAAGMLATCTSLRPAGREVCSRAICASRWYRAA